MIYEREELSHGPLVEAVVELRVTETLPFGIIPGGVYQLLKNEFAEVGTQQIPPPGIESFPQLEGLVTNKFSSQDKLQWILLGPSTFSVNVVGDYGAYSKFERLIKVALDAYLDVSKAKRIKRVSVRYINLIDATHFEPEADSPFEWSITLPSMVLPKPRTAVSRTTHEFPAERGALGVVMSVPHVLNDGKRGALLDLEFQLHDPPFSATPDVLDWVRDGHDVIYDAFRSLVLPSVYRKLR